MLNVWVWSWIWFRARLKDLQTDNKLILKQLKFPSRHRLVIGLLLNYLNLAIFCSKFIKQYLPMYLNIHNNSIVSLFYT